MSEEQLKMMAWAYCQGFGDAVSTLVEVSKALNEDVILKQFKERMSKQDPPHQPTTKESER